MIVATVLDMNVHAGCEDNGNRVLRSRPFTLPPIPDVLNQNEPPQGSYPSPQVVD